MTWYQFDTVDLHLFVYVQPNSKVTEWAGTHGDRIKVKVNAPPHKNAANQACQKFFAEFFQVPKTNIEQTNGAKSRAKNFLIKQPNRELVLNLIESLA
ncbi:MAG: DUF167 domain-containing protein [bacterium]